MMLHRKPAPLDREALHRRPSVTPNNDGRVATSIPPVTAPIILQRAVADPSTANPPDIIHLQRAYGNRAVSNLIQPQRNGDGFEADRDFERRLNAGRGSGVPLPSDVRSFMESRFGTDFGDVRLHADAEADQMNRELHSQAFTRGRDIYVRPDKYDPYSQRGRRLLAHELTHTIQQGHRLDRIARWGGPGDTTSHEEVTEKAFEALDPEIEMWYSDEAQRYLANMSEQMDRRGGFLFGSWMAGKVYGLTQKIGRRTARLARTAGRAAMKGGRKTLWGMRRGLGWLGEKAEWLANRGLPEGERAEAPVQEMEGAGNKGFWNKAWNVTKKGAIGLAGLPWALLKWTGKKAAQATAYIGEGAGMTEVEYAEAQGEQRGRDTRAEENEERRLAAEYDNLKTYWRSSSEAPNHGEGGMYRDYSGAERDQKRVNEYVSKAVKTYKGGNPRQALSILALGLHAAEDRGAHGDGEPGTGHDPRRSSPPPNEYADGTYWARSYQKFGKQWDTKWCDNKEYNEEGYDRSIMFGKEVLEAFAMGIGIAGGEGELTRSQVRSGGALAGFRRPGFLKRSARKVGIFFGKDVVRW